LMLNIVFQAIRKSGTKQGQRRWYKASFSRCAFIVDTTQLVSR
jgi:hypothetical protein